MDQEVSELIHQIFKKDDDATIINVDEYTGDILLESSLDDLPYEVVNIPSTLLLDESNQIAMDVMVRIIRILFLVNALLSFLTIMMGIVPFYILLTMPVNIARYVTIGLAVGCTLTYLLMLISKSQVVILIWMFLVCMTMGSICAVLKDIIPIQIATAVFMQSISIVFYTALSRRKLKVWLSIIIMIVVGLLTWTIGIYAFINQQDWISAGIAFILTFLFAVYSGLEIHYVDRYNLAKDSILSAIVKFYGDPVLQLFSIFKKK
jgi:hypothetical protein